MKPKIATVAVVSAGTGNEVLFQAKIRSVVKHHSTSGEESRWEDDIKNIGSPLTGFAGKMIKKNSATAILLPLAEKRLIWVNPSEPTKTRTLEKPNKT